MLRGNTTLEMILRDKTALEMSLRSSNTAQMIRGNFIATAQTQHSGKIRGNKHFFFKQLFSLCEYRNDTAFYYREKNEYFG